MLKSMNFLRGKSMGRVGEGGTSVCSVILRRYSLLEVPWRRIHNVIAHAMSMFNNTPHSALKRHSLPQGAREQKSVAFGNKVMDTRLPQPAGCGDKYDVSGLGWGLLLSTFCTFFKYPSPDAKASPSPARGEGMHRPWCHKILGTDCASRPRMTGGRGANSFGRSMIEMLGVLAIIAVLSVGGIAGYSKAMEKFKVNKLINEYSMLIFGLSEHEEEIKKLTQKTNLYSVASSLNIIPESWKNGTDDLGNNVAIFYTPRDGMEPRIVIDMYLGGIATNADGSKSTQGFSHQLCFELLQNIAYPLHESLYLLWIYRTGKEQNSTYMGDAYCGGARKCIKDLTVTEMDRLCKTCDKSNEACSVTLNF